jgi:hypothetical protein
VEAAGRAVEALRAELDQRHRVPTPPVLQLFAAKADSGPAPACRHSGHGARTLRRRNMRERILNRTTLDVLLLVLVLAWALQPSLI